MSSELTSAQNITYRNRNELIINLSLGEYFISSSIIDRETKMKLLLKKSTTWHDAIIREAIGTSRWEATDNIKLIPVENENKGLCEYVRQNYSSVFIN